MALDPVSALLDLFNNAQQKGLKEEELKAQLQQSLDQYAATFIKATSPDPASRIGQWALAVNAVLRALIVSMFAIGLIYKPMANVLISTLVALGQAGGPGYFYMSIIGWEFYGNTFLSALPWYKGNGNGKNNAQAPQANLPVVPADSPRSGSGRD
jgi:hypothetical protein